jgi:hypothetical protein
MMMDEINFTVSKFDRDVILEIAKRAKSIGRPDITLIDWIMDITATHANGNPLRLEALRDADDFNFMHDVYGISACLDRETGKLLNHFSPRFSDHRAEVQAA